MKGQYEALGGSFVVVDRPTELFPGAWLTGPVPRTYPERNWSLKRMIKQSDGRLVEDNVPEDMSLVLDTDKGLVVVAGCGHAGIINTLEYARRQVARYVGVRGTWGLSSVSSRRGHSGLDGLEAPVVRHRSDARRPLHRNRGGIRPAPAAWADAGDLRSRCGRCEV